MKLSQEGDWTLGSVPTIKLSPEGGLDTRWCASENAEPRMEVDCEISHRSERGTRANDDADPEGGGVDCEISHQLERETSASGDADPKGDGWIVRSHIDETFFRGWVDCEIPHRRNILYKGVETSISASGELRLLQNLTSNITNESKFFQMYSS